MVALITQVRKVPL